MCRAHAQAVSCCALPRRDSRCLARRLARRLAQAPARRLPPRACPHGREGALLSPPAATRARRCARPTTSAPPTRRTCEEPGVHRLWSNPAFLIYSWVADNPLGGRGVRVRIRSPCHPERRRCGRAVGDSVDAIWLTRWPAPECGMLAHPVEVPSTVLQAQPGDRSQSCTCTMSLVNAIEEAGTGPCARRS